MQMPDRMSDVTSQKPALDDPFAGAYDSKDQGQNQDNDDGFGDFDEF